MSNYITLMGAEEVSRASNRMADAAQEMQRAASAIDAALTQHRMFMDDWLSRLEQAMRAGEKS